MIADVVAHSFPGARGFPPEQVIPAAVVSLLATAQVLALAVRYRQGRLPWLDRLAVRAGRRNGLPPWAALPTKVLSTSLIVAVFGFYWDVAWHIDRGRDDGPFSTPAHYPIVLGLAGVALAGLLALILDHEPQAPVRLPFGLRGSVGGTLILLCGAIALSGFPLDDLWHTLFGQDVTLWSPTHIMMVGGASLSTLGLWMLVAEARRRAPAPPESAPAPGSGLRALLLRSDVRVAGSVLIGLSTLQGEFDFGVPQFSPLCQPVLIALAASVALVAARIRVGRGGALGAVVIFLGLRLSLGLLIGPVLGRSFLHVPLYVGEALLVELLAGRGRVARPFRFGAVAGLAAGTVGFATELAWTQVAMPLPWQRGIWVEAAVLAAVAGLCGGVIGASIGRALNGDGPLPGAPDPQPRRALPAVAMVGALAVLAIVVPIRTHSGWQARLTLTEVATGADRSVLVEVRPTTPAAARAARDAAWFHVLAWQGGDGTWQSNQVGQVLADLREVEPGVWRSDRPVPVHGQWKSFIRLATAWSMQSIPLYLPADPAIPAPEVAAPPAVTRGFVTDHELLQREATGGSEALKSASYLTLGAVGIGWLLCFALGMRRLRRVAASQPAGGASARLPRAEVTG